ncbi:MAG: LysR family transcriptional regulator [Polyangiaceae bacterium]
MDWQAVAFDWNRARAFLVTAEEGTFSAAARALGVAQPTIGRQIAALEEELGVALFERLGHDLNLTAAGLDLVEHVRAMNEAALKVALSAAGKSLDIDGTITLAASEAVATYLLPPMVRDLRALHPGIEVEIVASNQASDLRRREADIAIRNFRPSDPELVARKLRDSRAFVYASPDYLAAIGEPKTLAELAERAVVIAFDDVETFVKALRAMGLPFERRSFAIRSDNHLVQWQLAKAAAGVCIMMEEVGDRESGVVRVLPDLIPPIPVPVWLTSHRELQTSRRIRVVFDFLAAAFEGDAEMVTAR